MTYPKNQLVIDVSHWNTIDDWNAIASSGVVGVIHKFSEGTGYRDPTYEERRTAARHAGLKWGRYHFANDSDVDQQIHNALADARWDDLIALDWEDSDSTMRLDQAEEFVTKVREKTGQTPVLYSGNTAKEALKKPSAVLSRCRLWLAHYANQPVCPPGWNNPWIWQWTDQGSIRGVDGDVDLDSFDGTPGDLISSWIGRPPRSEPDDPTPAPASTTVMVTTQANGLTHVHIEGRAVVTRS